MTTPPRGGRPRVGDPASELPGHHRDDGRIASRQSGIVLATGQRDRLAHVAGLLHMSGSGLIRRAAERLVAGDIPKPRKAGDIPPPEPPEDDGKAAPQRTVVLGQLAAALARYAADVPDRVLFPPPPKSAPARRGRPPNRETRARDALIRYALDHELAREEQQLTGKAT